MFMYQSCGEHWGHARIPMYPCHRDLVHRYLRVLVTLAGSNLLNLMIAV
jgi:hypothetical protein